MKTPQQLRDLADAIEAHERGESIEAKSLYGSDCPWLKIYSPDFSDDRYAFRPAPKPVTRPWDFNSRPRETVWVFKKGYITDSMIVAWGDDVVVLATKRELENVGYGDLFRDYSQRDGSVCGTTEDAQ